MPTESALAESGDHTGSLIRLVNAVLRYRWSVTRWIVGLALLVPAVALLQPTTYTATGSFVPESGIAAQSRFAGLAAQFGVSLPVSIGTSESPMFYADLLTTRSIQMAALQKPYVLADAGESRNVSLLDLLEAEGDTPEERVEDGRKELEDALTVTVDNETGVVELSVRTRWPTVSQQVATNLLELVNAFNLNTRQSRGAEERRFVDERLKQSRTELREAEDRLQQFLQANRDFRNSPHLTFTWERLQREVSMRQQVYTSLAQAYEQARIEEVRNTPLVTVIQAPAVPVEPDSRHLVAKMILAAVLGALVGMALALWRDYVDEQARDGAPEMVTFRELKRQVIGELREPSRLLRRMFRN